MKKFEDLDNFQTLGDPTPDIQFEGEDDDLSDYNKLNDINPMIISNQSQESKFFMKQSQNFKKDQSNETKANKSPVLPPGIYFY